MSRSEEDQKRALIARRLKEARNLAGLSQTRTAELLGMHRPTVTEIEAGNRRVSAEEIPRFADLYDVSVAWVLGEAPDSLDSSDPKLELAARELSKLKPQELERLMRLLAAMRVEKARSK
jgi:transcriptional regulator with XRE-family HTH domain